MSSLPFARTSAGSVARVAIICGLAIAPGACGSPRGMVDVAGTMHASTSVEPIRQAENVSPNELLEKSRDMLRKSSSKTAPAPAREIAADDAAAMMARTAFANDGMRPSSGAEAAAAAKLRRLEISGRQNADLVSGDEEPGAKMSPEEIMWRLKSLSRLAGKARAATALPPAAVEIQPAPATSPPPESDSPPHMPFGALAYVAELTAGLPEQMRRR